jgi:hypothetical protein
VATRRLKDTGENRAADDEPSVSQYTFRSESHIEIIMSPTTWKKTFDNGRTAKVMHKDGSVSGAWIDDDAAYVEAALNERPQQGNPLEKAKSLTAYMAKNELLFCPDCQEFYVYTESVGTGFAGHKCAECANEDATCDDGGDHEWVCTNPHQKHNARVSTRYKCEKCKETKKAIATG